MTRRPTFSRLPAFTLIAFLILAPALAAAQPLERAALLVAEGSGAAPNLFSRLWNLLSAALANGSILEPNGASSVLDRQRLWLGTGRLQLWARLGFGGCPRTPGCSSSLPGSGTAGDGDWRACPDGVSVADQDAWKCGEFTLRHLLFRE